MPLINSLLVRSGDGWSERTDAPSIAANSRFEAYLALGAIQTQDGVDAYADAQLDLYATAREEVNTGIAPIGDSDTPYIGYSVGDVVTVPNSAGAPVAERVRGITVTENDDTGIAVYSPQFKDFILERDEQIQIAIKKMSNGSLAGSSQVAQPIREDFTPRDVSFPVGSSGMPFIVVANDGTGDFSSIKAAVDSVSTQAFIWVKYTGTVYSDATTVAFGTKKIVIFGGGSSYTNSSSGVVRWNVSGSPDMSASAGAVIEFRNIQIVQIVATGFFGGSSGMAIGFYGSYTDQECNANYGSFHARDSVLQFGPSVPFFDVQDCLITFQAGSYSMRSSRVTDCFIQGSGSVTFDCPGTSTGEGIIFNDNQITIGTFAFTGWTQVDFVGNISSAEVVAGPTLTNVCTVSFASCRNVHYDSNLWGGTVSFSATGTNNRGTIGGSAFVMTIAGSGYSFNVTIEGDRGLGSTPAGPGLLISGSNNVGTVFVNNYTTAVRVSGDNNVLAVAGSNITTLLDYPAGGDNNKAVIQVGATVADAGAGNVAL